VDLTRPTRLVDARNKTNTKYYLYTRCSIWTIVLILLKDHRRRDRTWVLLLHIQLLLIITKFARVIPNCGEVYSIQLILLIITKFARVIPNCGEVYSIQLILLIITKFARVIPNCGEVYSIQLCILMFISNMVFHGDSFFLYQ
jgi:hypothetical protein